MQFNLMGLTGQEDGVKLFYLDKDPLWNEAIGDGIGISKEDKALWVADDLDMLNKEITEFFENFFEHPIDAFSYVRSFIDPNDNDWDLLYRGGN